MPVQLQVREHDTLVRGAHHPTWSPNLTALPPQAFDAIEALLLGPQYDLNPVAIAAKVGGQSALKLTQWVGVLRAPDGTTIEILPKTHERPGARAAPDSLERSRALLLRMLSATDERFRVAPPADLEPAKMPLYEVVLRYVLEGVRAALRRGVPHAYVPVQEERPGLRGRLDLPRQMRQPRHRAHLLHVTYDEFLPDRPETRLTRLTVERVASLTRDTSNRRLARELLRVLDDVPPSHQIAQDFAAWNLGRGHLHFTPLEGLCRLVLYELNPLVSGHRAQAQALLFDMNRVYEAYVAQRLRTEYPDWRIETQVQGRWLGTVTQGNQRAGAFGLRPDLLITLPDQRIIVADTKWKRLKPEKAPTYDVSSADAYQMFAYSHVFQHPSALGHVEVWLLYPQMAGLPPLRTRVEFGEKRFLHLLTLDLHSNGLFDLPEMQLSSTNC
ncbi:hypothetical protein FNU79_14035 [Deinococcus detaillensis]|uniref:Restriction endonuclease n=1 Tax=Deinococcus detaillensis TaxID=2592048 RepID=A0A553UPQ7_9DEIO|nr:hypothetical protein FNU79_14035 [Deinococcus detaillensis]